MINPSPKPWEAFFPRNHLHASTMTKASRACALVVVLRLLAFSITATATVVMATSHQTATFFNFTFEAKFQHTPAFKFFVITNAIAAAYSLLVLFVPSTAYLTRLVLGFDVVITMLLTAAISASGAIAEVGKKGNQHAGWLPICGQVHKFCDQMMGSMICGFVAVLIYLAILLRTIYKFNQILQ